MIQPFGAVEYATRTPASPATASGHMLAGRDFPSTLLLIQIVSMTRYLCFKTTAQTSVVKKCAERIPLNENLSASFEIHPSVTDRTY